MTNNVVRGMTTHGFKTLNNWTHVAHVKGHKPDHHKTFVNVRGFTATTYVHAILSLGYHVDRDGFL